MLIKIFLSIFDGPGSLWSRGFVCALNSWPQHITFPQVMSWPPKKLSELNISPPGHRRLMYFHFCLSQVRLLHSTCGLLLYIFVCFLFDMPVMNRDIYSSGMCTMRLSRSRPPIYVCFKPLGIIGKSSMCDIWRTTTHLDFFFWKNICIQEE